MLPKDEVLAKHAWPVIAIINKLTGNSDCKSQQTNGTFISNNSE